MLELGWVILCIVATHVIIGCFGLDPVFYWRPVVYLRRIDGKIIKTRALTNNTAYEHPIIRRNMVCLWSNGTTTSDFNNIVAWATSKKELENKP